MNHFRSIRARRHALRCLLLLCAAQATAGDIGGAASQLAMLTPATRNTLDGMPTDRELEARGARIGHILIVVDDVFEQSMSLAAPYRIVNSLHVSTHTATVNQQLLFREGDAFDRRVLDETERLLREQRYLSDASVQTLHYNGDNSVDVIVRVHDVWTMSPGISFGRKGGENSTKFEFEDTNFLGLGKTISLERAQNVDRNAWRLAYLDPHVLGTWWRLSGAHSTLSDGSEDVISFGRPFYSLDSRWSAGVDVADSESTLPRYSLGKEIERFGARVLSIGVDGGVSHGLVDGWTTRYLFGVRYDDRAYTLDSSAPDALIPEDRRYVYPYAGVQWLEDAYIRTRNLNQIGRTEDLHLGRSLTMTAGLASSAFGSTSSAVLLTTRGEAGLDLGSEQYLVGGFDASSRIEGDGFRNASVGLGGQFYRRQSQHRVMFVGLDARWTANTDGAEQLLLGGDNGLRGYPLRYQAGASSAVFTLEQRFYTDWQPLKLVNVGAAVFADTGRMWGRDPFAATPQGWLSDVGVGLRLGSARSGLGNILHIDLAFPLNRADDIDSMQLLIETKKSF
jgi:outer membrane protein assembly factor BamA